VSSLIVNGGRELHGKIAPSGNKNSILPMLCASLFASEPVTIHNVPDITDARKIVAFLESLGARIEGSCQSGSLRIDARNLAASFDPASLPSGMRSSVLLLPGLLHRFGHVTLSEAKGCFLGSREIDPHIALFVAGGAALNGSELSLPSSGFRPVDLWPDYASVTLTENFLMMAAAAKGTSVLRNSASEPHVQDLCRMLAAMGCEIQGAGTNVLTVTGRNPLQGADVTVSDDHHEIFTFLALGAICGGAVSTGNAVQHHFPLIDRCFLKLGVKIEHCARESSVAAKQSLEVERPFTANMMQKIEGAPWPYFPVDLLPPMMALATRCNGEILFWNKVYEGAFFWLPEMAKFGALSFLADPHRAIVFGKRPLHAATVEAPYIIRAAISLMMIALSVPGKSVIHNADPIRRAHPRFIEKLRGLGAEISWSEAEA
jgi:UDP-N-acetylglucosamine 1-carboxyvinyltransferase